MFSSAQSGDFLLPSAFSSITRIFEHCVCEICLRLRYAQTEIQSLQSDVQYVTLPVTEIPRIFIHSCNFWLMAAGPALSNLNYENNFWRPRSTNNLPALACHMQWMCTCDIKWNRNVWLLCLSLFLPVFFPLTGFISSAVDVATPGLLSYSGYRSIMHGVLCHMLCTSCMHPHRDHISDNIKINDLRKCL